MKQLYHACMLWTLADNFGGKIRAVGKSTVTLEFSSNVMRQHVEVLCRIRGLASIRCAGRRLIVKGVAARRSCCEGLVEKCEKVWYQRNDMSRGHAPWEAEAEADEPARDTDGEPGDAPPLLGVLGFVPRRRDHFLDRLFPEVS